MLKKRPSLIAGRKLVFIPLMFLCIGGLYMLLPANNEGPANPISPPQPTTESYILEESMAAGDSLGVVHALNALAQEAFRSKRHAEVFAYMDRVMAMDPVQAGIPDEVLAVSWLFCGRSLKYRQNQEEGLVALRESERLFRESGDTRSDHFAELNYYFGRHFIFVDNNPTEAQNYLREAIQTAMAVPGFPQEEMAQYYHLLGQAATGSGENRKALEYFKNALAIRQEVLGDSSFFKGTTLTSLGNSHFNLGETEAALEAYLQALAIFRHNADHPKTKINQASVMNNIAVCYEELGQYDAAFRTHESLFALQEAEFQSHPQIAIISHLNIAIANRNLGNLSEARKHFLASLKIANTHAYSPEDLAKINQEYALLFEMEGNPKQALALTEQSLTALKNAELSGLAVTEFSSLNAEMVMKECLAFKARMCNAHPELWGSETEAYDQAILLIREYDRLVNQLKRQITIQSDKLNITSENDHGYYYGLEAAWKMWNTTQKPQYAIDALQFMDHSHSQVLLEKIAKSNARYLAGIPTHLTQRDDSLSQQINTLEAALMQHPNPEQQALLVNLRLAKEALADTIRAIFPGFDTWTVARTQPFLQVIREQILQDSSAFIEYFLHEETLFGYMVTADTFQWHRMQMPEGFKDTVKHFFELTSQPPSFDGHHAQLGTLGHRLYQLLLAPFTRSAPLPKHLILVPDGPLNLISFDALCSRPYTGTSDRYRDLSYLIYDHIISYGNSAGLLAEQGAIEHQQHNGQCIGFAWSNGKAPNDHHGLRKDTQWPDLPGTATELGVVSQYVQGKYYLGPDAKESTFKSETQPFGILHIALHGTAGEEEPSLIFPVEEDGQEDGIIYLNEMYGMRFLAELAVLSACESGVGIVHNEEGLLSMARGFQFAGIPTVVTNLWEVEDRAAHMITGTFYEDLSHGKSVAEALRHARISYIQGSPNSNASPFFWASYVSLGKSGPVKLAMGQSKKTRWEWWLVGALGLLAAFFFRNYQRNHNRKSLS